MGNAQIGVLAPKNRLDTIHRKPMRLRFLFINDVVDLFLLSFLLFLFVFL